MVAYVCEILSWSLHAVMFLFKENSSTDACNDWVSTISIILMSAQYFSLNFSDESVFLETLL